MTTNIQDKLALISRGADLDIAYGPYASTMDADLALTALNNGNNRVEGRTVGVIDPSGEVVEYWYQNIGGALVLVKKSVKVDEEPTENSNNAVSSNGVYSALGSKLDKAAIDTTNNLLIVDGIAYDLVRHQDTVYGEIQISNFGYSAISAITTTASPNQFTVKQYINGVLTTINEYSVTWDFADVISGAVTNNKTGVISSIPNNTGSTRTVARVMITVSANGMSAQSTRVNVQQNAVALPDLLVGLVSCPITSSVEGVESMQTLNGYDPVLQQDLTKLQNYITNNLSALQTKNTITTGTEYEWTGPTIQDGNYIFLVKNSRVPSFTPDTSLQDYIKASEYTPRKVFNYTYRDTNYSAYICMYPDASTDRFVYKLNN